MGAAEDFGLNSQHLEQCKYDYLTYMRGKPNHDQ